ncbi:hypothetical protein B7494_g3300 [Chlorociboria aeruginascens]|nr:hypothetical protein B7494_g3300 [Chlorociboria aeruginascens]
MAPSISENPTLENQPVTNGHSIAGNLNILESELYTIEPVAGKGKGMIAQKTIQPGTLMLSESPLFTTEDILSIETTEKDLARTLRALPKASQRAFLSLHNNFPGKEPISNIVRSNAYPLGPSSGVGAIFLTIARINHSCRPNAQHSWNPTLKKESVYAVRPIAPGDEITLSYHNGGPSSTRQKELQEFFGFKCTCDLCSLSPDLLKASDARLIRAQNLDAAIGDPERARMLPEKVLADCKSLLLIFKAEGVVDTRLPRLYYDAFQICAMHSDRLRAKVFAERYVELKVLSEGEQSEDAREMRVFAQEPEKHDSFGVTEKWKGEHGPEGLEEDTLEKWLWRESF